MAGPSVTARLGWTVLSPTRRLDAIPVICCWFNAPPDKSLTLPFDLSLDRCDSKAARKLFRFYSARKIEKSNSSLNKFLDFLQTFFKYLVVYYYLLVFVRLVS